MPAGIITLLVQFGAGLGLGGLAGGPFGGVVGAVAGLVAGGGYGWAIASARVYRGGRGLFLFVVDHTWGLPNTFAGALFLAVNLLRRNRLDRPSSDGSGCVRLAGEFFRDFATTVGTVEAGATSAIQRHEDTHVLQARLFGPFYLPLIAVHYALATLVPYWLAYHDRGRRPIDSVATYFRRGVYPHVWHEEWAYRVQGQPPL
jgi:hypothetical protein